MNFLEKFFKLAENKTNVRTEVLGGLTTFMTMSYIIFVNPAILSRAGIPFEPTVTATAWAAGLTTLIMGLYTNYPIALASGMGLNAVLTYNIVVNMRIPWQVGMGMIVIEGLIITLLVLTNLRVMVMNAIPLNLKRAIGIGIGLFIAFIGLKEAGFIVSHPATFVTAGNFMEKAVWLSIAGLLISIILLLYKVQGALLLGMLATTTIAGLMGIIKKPSHFFSLPHFSQTFFECNIKGALHWQFVPIIFAFLMTDFFDTMGTVIAIGEEGKFIDSKGNVPRLKKILLVDSLSAVIGGLFSASSVTSYIESATGVAQGARTGLANIVTALAFFLAPFLSPLVQLIGGGVPTSAGILNPITAPALIIVGFLMMTLVREIPWDDFEEAFPAFLVIIGMPLTFSISHGIGLGFISYTLIKIFRGKFKDVHPLLYPVSALFTLTFIIH